MKNWIIKYKAEFVKNNMPSDDLYDSRELAKWYRMWRVLFPSLETPVPSPCESKCILNTTTEKLILCSSKWANIAWRYESRETSRSVAKGCRIADRKWSTSTYWWHRTDSILPGSYSYSIQNYCTRAWIKCRLDVRR
jgi:hypothetical protein